MKLIIIFRERMITNYWSLPECFASIILCNPPVIPWSRYCYCVPILLLLVYCYEPHLHLRNLKLVQIVIFPTLSEQKRGRARIWTQVSSSSGVLFISTLLCYFPTKLSGVCGYVLISSVYPDKFTWLNSY